jgi:enoyl-CoA hydratase/carnithine racemase
VPIIAAIHGYCIGVGIDLSSACDIRICTKDSKLTIKEVDIGICADLGTV